ncbi:hypothetical protein LO772_06050 [Yinghuangia sp. ASG 101]|uniref:hypothetical protein n=1 Tax=Yinghuangia sp. ASG 101 TaxID=2896848 RepID=UPI001E28A0DE|nr:hypothetical protein [Yinghuangia sp. ASG 101]UGQ13176.1 hypothetical protein LO772_06050 [Yinghuangia sp. ASG 101]
MTSTIHSADSSGGPTKPSAVSTSAAQGHAASASWIAVAATMTRPRGSADRSGRSSWWFGLCLGPVVSTATVGVAPEEAGAASGLLGGSRRIGAALGLAVPGTAAHDRTGDAVTAEALNDGHALGLTLRAALLPAAVVVALAVLPRTRPTEAGPEPADAEREPRTA